MAESDFGPQMNYEANGMPGGGPPGPGGEGDRGRTGRPGGEWAAGLVEKLTSAERPGVVRWRLWRALEGVVDEGDDWTARILKDRIHAKVAELEERTDDSVAKLEGTTASESKEEKDLFNEFKEADQEVKDVLKFFLEFGGMYMRSRGSSEYLGNLAINPLTAEITADIMQRIFNMPGLNKELKGWPSLGDQILLSMMGYEYIALLANPELKLDREYLEKTRGFRRLFESVDPKEWVFRLKLALHTRDLGLEGKTVEQLSDEERRAVEESPMYSRYSAKINTERRDAIKTAVQELIVGPENGKDTVAKKQAEIAEKLGFIASFIFGQAAYYGTFLSEGAEEVAVDGFPLSDVFAEIFNPQDWVRDRGTGKYWMGPRSKKSDDVRTAIAGFPQRMHVPFFRFNIVRDPLEPKNKLKARTLWEQVWVEGRKGGDLGWKQLQEFAMRNYLLRPFLLLRKPGEAGPAGIMGVFRGDDWRVRDKILEDQFYWKEVRRWIHVIVADQLVVNGQYQRWLEERGIGDASEAGRQLKKAVAEERKSWKEMIMGTIHTWYSSMPMGRWPEIQQIAKESGFWWD